MSAPAKPPEGMRFTHVYDPKPRTARDSQRFRRRLAAEVAQCSEFTDLTTAITREIGLDIPWNGTWNWPGYFNEAAIEAVLDTITVVGRTLSRVHSLNAVQRSAQYKHFVARALREEGLGRMAEGNDG